MARAVAFPQRDNLGLQYHSGVVFHYQSHGDWNVSSIDLLISRNEHLLTVPSRRRGHG